MTINLKTIRIPAAIVEEGAYWRS